MTFLEYLAGTIGCEYLSDLHFVCINERQAECILRLSDNLFPEKDYKEAAAYLLGGKVSGGKTVHELKKLIVQKLIENKK